MGTTRSTSPASVAWQDLPLAPKKASAFDVVLSDPRVRVVEPAGSWGPETFAVGPSGDLT